MKKALIIIIYISIFFFQSCLSNIIYNTEDDYICAARNAYIEYKKESNMGNVRNVDSKNFQLTESYYSKAFELNSNDLALINEILKLYWDENLPDKFVHWIEIFINASNDKYKSYLY